MPIIEVKNLTKKFGDFTAVDNVSFSVEKGKVAAFLGPNGAGKTTTIKMLTTILHPTAGDFSINGFSKHETDSIRRSFGIVFQDPSLDDDLTAEENLMFHAELYHVPHDIAKKKMVDALKFVDLADRQKSMVKTFSGGMKRRLEIARSLMHTPRVLFLDEPTLGLDPQTRNKMWEYIEKLKTEQGLTVLFTTHYMQEAEKAADIVYIIDHGKIIEQGTVDEIKTKHAVASLEDAFLKLTGGAMREEAASGQDEFRNMAKMWGGTKR